MHAPAALGGFSFSGCFQSHEPGRKKQKWDGTEIGWGWREMDLIKAHYMHTWKIFYNKTRIKDQYKVYFTFKSKS